MQPDLQRQFFERIKMRIAPHLNMVDEIGDLLGIGSDSVYRRMRGDTALTLEEAIQLANKFHISLDTLRDMDAQRVDFDAGPVIASADDYQKYTTRILHQMLAFQQSREEMHMTYAALDFPLFYIFMFPNVARLKSYYWGRSILGLPEFKAITYQQFLIPEERRALAEEIVKAYIGLNSTELWSSTCYLSTLKQVQLYWETGVFTQADEALSVLNDLDRLLDYLVAQSECGRKINPATGQPVGGSFGWYITDLRVGQNVAYMEKPSGDQTFLSYNSFNFLETTHPYFTQQTKKWMDELLTKSTLATGSGQAQRDKYVGKLRKQVDAIRRLVVEAEDTIL